MPNVSDVILTHVRSAVPYLYMVTHEEDRVISSIQYELIGSKEGSPSELRNDKIVLYVWSIAYGLMEVTTIGSHMSRAWPMNKAKAGESPRAGVKPIGEGTQNFNAALEEFLNRPLPSPKHIGVLVAKDLPAFFQANNKNHIYIRALRDAQAAVSGGNRTIVMTYPERVIPPELERVVRVVDVPLPSKEELKEHLETRFLVGIKRAASKSKDSASEIKTEYTEEEKLEIASAAAGMTLSEFNSSCNMSVAIHKAVLPEFLSTAKKDIVKKSGALEYLEPTTDLGQVGGLDQLKGYLSKRHKAMSEKARQAGIHPPKGVVLLGFAGCGKSLIAKSMGADWRLPVIRLDVGAVYGSLVGASEANIRQALKVVEAAAPCILFVDSNESPMPVMA